MRSEIEMFHKIPKSGCKVESSKLRTAERLANRFALFLNCRVAHSLIRDVQSLLTKSASTAAAYRTRGHLFGRVVPTRSSESTATAFLETVVLQTRAAGRISRSRERLTPGQHYYVTRIDQVNRHRIRLSACTAKCG